jgi:ribosomal protein L35AE/L33A
MLKMLAISPGARRCARYPRKGTMEKYRRGVSRLEPAVYRIRIQGILDKNWSDYYGGMTIEHEGEPKHYAITILMGKLSDQSALIGVLNALFDIGYPILSVEYLEAG